MVPKSESASRIERLQQHLAAMGLDGALLVYGVDILYYTGTRQNAILWVPATDAPVLLVRKSYARAREEAGIDIVRPFAASKDIPQLLAGVRRIGLTFDVLPVQLYNLYAGLLPDCAFVDISALNRELRAVKSSWELAQLRASGQQLSAIFGQVPSFLAAGMREIDVAAELEFRLRKAGGPGFFRMRGFNQEAVGIAAGASAASTGCFDGPATGKGISPATPFGSSLDIICANEPVLIDYGCVVNGYIVDMTRIFVIGFLPEELHVAFETALQIEAWIVDNLKPGVICENLYAGALAMAESAGLADHFMGATGSQARFVGHGVGLELDELPILAPKFKQPLAPGNVIAVEPKFIFPGRGVVGIENTYALTQSGPEKITDLDNGIVTL